jgi:hypothetical protein
MRKPNALLLLAALAACAGSAAPARAETVNCTPILALPATISQQGVYCLTGNLSTSQALGTAISVLVPNVTIDLNGWKLGGQGAGLGTQAKGIESSQANITVKNGTIRGFESGVVLHGRGSVVQDLLLDQNTFRGIYVAGQGAMVEHNQVVATGGSTVQTYVEGIAVFGAESVIDGNLVTGLSGSKVCGICINDGDCSTVRGNSVTASSTPPDSHGILVTALGIAVVSNTVSNFTYGIRFWTGFDNGIYAGNTVTACGTSFSGGIPGHGNSP